MCCVLKLTLYFAILLVAETNLYFLEDFKMSNLDAIKDQIDTTKNEVIDKFKNLAIVTAIDAEFTNSTETTETDKINQIHKEVENAVDSLKVTENNFKDWFTAIVGRRGSQKLNSFIREIQGLPDQLTEHIYSEIQEACRKLKSEPHHRRSYVGDVKVVFSDRKQESFKSITVVEEKWGDSDENKIIKVEANLKINTAQFSNGPYFTSNTEIREWISTVELDVADIKVLSEENQANVPWVLVEPKS